MVPSWVGFFRNGLCFSEKNSRCHFIWFAAFDLHWLFISVNAQCSHMQNSFIHTRRALTPQYLLLAITSYMHTYTHPNSWKHMYTQMHTAAITAASFHINSPNNMPIKRQWQTEMCEYFLAQCPGILLFNYSPCLEGMHQHTDPPPPTHTLPTPA